MFLNALKIALRNLQRNRGYAFLNIFGLALGFACAMLIGLFIRDELSYDRFHPQANRIHRMALNRIYPDHTTSYAVIPHSFGPVVVQDLPEVEAMTRVVNFGNEMILRQAGQSVEVKGAVFTDSTFADVFGFELLHGEVKEALDAQDGLVLTASAAKRLFGRVNAVGETIDLNWGNEWKPITVGAVLADIPEQSHLPFDYLLSIDLFDFIRGRENFTSFSAHTYLLLAPGTDPATVEAKFPQVVEQYAAGEIQRSLGVSYQDYLAAGNRYEYFLQPLPDIHLTSQLEGEHQPNGNISYVYLFVAIALFILLIAAINFMNLATARSAERAREVGVRKVLGSLRSQLVLQFLLEAVVLSGASMLLALGLVWLAQPAFTELAGRSIDWGQIADWAVWPWLLLLTLVVGLLAGSYPSMALSRFRPVEVLKGHFRSTAKGRRLRNGLVVFQFWISIALMAATAVVYQQMQYIRSKDLGYQRERILTVDRAGLLQTQQKAFRTEILRNPQIQAASFTNAMPGGYYFGATLQESVGAEVKVVRAYVADEHYLETLDIEVLAGRDFRTGANDSFSVVLNQAAVGVLGIADPIGKALLYVNGDQQTTVRVVGIMEDFHYQSLHTEVGALMMFNEDFPGLGTFQLAIRLAKGADAEALADVEAQWQQMIPEQPFRYTYFDDTLDQLYVSEQASGRLFGTFAGLAIVIACLGLFGLSAFTAQQRTKEIGIRKVLGASLANLMYLLSREITVLIWAAFLLAVPVVWWLMDSWLEDFAYHISLRPGVFALAGMAATLIAWLTVSYQSIRAALMDPVRALRDE